MTQRTRLGLNVLGAALLLGLLGDALLRVGPWGINVLLWVGVLVAASFALAREKRLALAGEGSWLLPSALGFAAAFAWRDSATLRFLDALAILVLLALFTLRARGGRVRLAGLTDYLVAGLVSGVSALFGGLLLLFNDIGWKEIPRGGWSRHALAVVRGLAIGVPLVLVFGALFVAADAIFEGLVRDTFNFDSGVAVSHVLVFFAFGWLSLGFLRTAFLGKERAATGTGLPAHVALGFNDPPAEPARTREGGSASRTDAGADFKAAADFKVESVTREREDEKSALAPPSVTDESASTTDTTSSTTVSNSSTNGAASTTTGTPPTQTAQTGAAPAQTGAAAQSVAASDTADASAAAAYTGWPVPKPLPPKTLKTVSLGVVEVSVVLGLLNVLFFSFVVVQLRYFFGGSGVVLSSADMTYAEYARRGFFELAWVAALVLPLLLAAHWLLRKQNPAHERIFRALSGGLLLMLFVIMASAFGRMRLYQSEYGQTELRFYVTAFMGWLAVVFVWFALTVLRGERERFACGALVAALAIVGGLHFANPNALIVRTNTALAREKGRGFDVSYASSLGADSVPALLESLPEMHPQARGYVAARLLERAQADNSDWRSWNWSRARARGAVAGSEPMLREWVRQTSWPGVTRAADGEPKVADAGARAGDNGAGATDGVQTPGRGQESARLREGTRASSDSGK